MTFSFKRVIVSLLVLIPMFFLLVFTSLVVFGADYPGKIQANRFSMQVKSFLGKTKCRLEGNKVQNEMMGAWRCVEYCKPGYVIPKKPDIFPSDATFPGCVCKGSWENGVCQKE